MTKIAAKLNEVPSFMNKTKQVHNLILYSKQTQRHKY